MVKVSSLHTPETSPSEPNTGCFQWYSTTLLPEIGSNTAVSSGMSSMSRATAMSVE